MWWFGEGREGVVVLSCLSFFASMLYILFSWVSSLHSTVYRIHYCMAMISLYIFAEMESNTSDINSIKLSDLANSNTHNVFDSVTHYVQKPLYYVHYNGSL